MDASWRWFGRLNVPEAVGVFFVNVLLLAAADMSQIKKAGKWQTRIECLFDSGSEHQPPI